MNIRREAGEQRRHLRELVVERVSLAWTDAGGTPRTIQGKCLDNSGAGVKIQLSDSIPVGTTVFVRSQTLGVNGPARVRYCRRQGMNFVVGLEHATIRHEE